MTARISPALAPSRPISPPVAAAALIKVAATILSGMTEYSQPCSFSTPLIVIVPPPAPLIFAPQQFRNSARSHISGSLAALYITVSPFARTAASMMFSVAPTEGNERSILAPLSPLEQVQLSTPYSSFILTPIFLSAHRCISIGLGPSSHPPGNDSLHSPVLPRTAPRKTIDERISLISSSGTKVFTAPLASTVTQPSSRLHLAPSTDRMRQAANTSESAGQLCSLISPFIRTHPASSGRAAFFAP